MRSSSRVRRTLLAPLAGLLLCAAANARPAQPPEPQPDAAAATAFEKLIKAYRARPALTVKSTLKLEVREGDMASAPQTSTAALTYSRGGSGLVKIRDFVCTFGDGVFTAVHTQTDDGYYREEYEGSAYWPLFNTFQDLPYPHIGILWGEEAPEEVWMLLELNSTPSLVPTAVSEVVVNGATLQRIDFTCPDGTLRMDVDPKTRLIQTMVHEITGGPMVPAGSMRRGTYTLEYTLYDEPRAEADLALDTAGRQRVDFLASLMPAPAAPVPAPPGAPPMGGAGGALVGRPAPSFVLATADGKAVDLEDLRGKVVVLDFWATWCAPCRRALPLLHEVDAWVRQEELPVEILTINVWEARDPAQDTPDARLAAVRAFWKKSGYTLPVAMDYADETAAAYGVTGIPATFVIRSDGVVHAQSHPAVDVLKGDIRAAIAALEPAGAPDP